MHLLYNSLKPQKSDEGKRNKTDKSVRNQSLRIIPALGFARWHLWLISNILDENTQNSFRTGWQKKVQQKRVDYIEQERNTSGEKHARQKCVNCASICNAVQLIVSAWPRGIYARSARCIWNFITSGRTLPTNLVYEMRQGVVLQVNSDQGWG